MPRECQICISKKRKAIEQAIVDGETLVSIAKRFSVSRFSLESHKRLHIRKLVAKAKEVYEIASANSLLEQLRLLQDKALSLLRQAEDAGDYRTAMAGVREARGCLELLGKITGELAPGGVNVAIQNVVNRPDQVDLRASLARKLDIIHNRLEAGKEEDVIEGEVVGVKDKVNNDDGTMDSA